MLPPALQGYAPEIQGIARGNATVTVSQSGRIIYQTTVPAGPFNIQDLRSSVRGTLDVRVGDEGEAAEVVAEQSEQRQVEPRRAVRPARRGNRTGGSRMDGRKTGRGSVKR